MLFNLLHIQWSYVSSVIFCNCLSPGNPPHTALLHSCYWTGSCISLMPVGGAGETRREKWASPGSVGCFLGGSSSTRWPVVCWTPSATHIQACHFWLQPWSTCTQGGGFLLALHAFHCPLASVQQLWTFLVLATEQTSLLFSRLHLYLLQPSLGPTFGNVSSKFFLSLTTLPRP